MLHVVMDTIPLADDRKVRALVKRLGVPRLEPPWLRGAAFGRPLGELAFWERYLVDRRTTFVWREGKDVWLSPHSDKAILRRVVTTGLKDEREAKVFRSEAWRGRQEPFSVDSLTSIAEDVVEQRSERAYQRNFLHFLQDIRRYFKWQDGKVVNSEGFLLSIDKSGLFPEDIEVLRQVYAALPRTVFSPDGGMRWSGEPSGEEVRLKVEPKDEPCPLCGGEGAKVREKKVKPLADRRTARKAIGEAARKDIARASFMAWINARLTDEAKGGIWTLGSLLYGDYEEWLLKRSGDQTVGDHSESKAAKMSTTAWGILMGRLFAKRRNGRGKTAGNLYNVRLKKR